MTRETFRVTDPIRATDTLHRLPTGTVIADATNTWTKLADGRWQQVGNGSRWRATDFSMAGVNTIRSFPSGMDTFDAPMETVERVKWKFRVGALANAQSHGVAIRQVEEALAAMGAGPSDLPLGRGVRISDQQTKDSLPEGSVMYSGTPAQPSGFAVFAKKGGQWVHVLGEQTWMDNEATIESVGRNRDRPEWLDREGDESDAQAIREFKAAAWRIGYQLKRSNSWCGTYEDIVHRLGVHESDLRAVRNAGMRADERITAEQAAALPVGSLLYWYHQDDSNRFALFERVAGATNQAGTRLVWTTEDSRDNYRRYMNIAGIADDQREVEWLVPSQPANLFENLPAGTVFTYRQGGAERYMKIGQNAQGVGTIDTYNDGQRPIHDVGRYTIDNFGRRPEWTIRRFQR